jgi:hypothetical protein
MGEHTAGIAAEPMPHAPCPSMAVSGTLQWQNPPLNTAVQCGNVTVTHVLL